MVFSVETLFFTKFWQRHVSCGNGACGTTCCCGEATCEAPVEDLKDIYIDRRKNIVGVYLATGRSGVESDQHAVMKLEFSQNIWSLVVPACTTINMLNLYVCFLPNKLL